MDAIGLVGQLLDKTVGAHRKTKEKPDTHSGYASIAPQRRQRDEALGLRCKELHKWLVAITRAGDCRHERDTHCGCPCGTQGCELIDAAALPWNIPPKQQQPARHPELEEGWTSFSFVSSSPTTPRSRWKRLTRTVSRTVTTTASS